MNRKEIRDEVFARLDWDPSPTAAAVSRINSFINRAYQQLALEAPFLFFESFIRIATQVDAESYDDDDTIQMITTDGVTGNPENPWVFRTTKAVGAANTTAWADDRSWDGRVIEIIDDDGVVHQNQIRSVWKITIVATEYYVFSLAKPWPWGEYGDGPFTWRVYTHTYYLPDNFIEMRSARIVGDEYPLPLEILSQADAERIGVVDHTYSQNGTGAPQVAYRRGFYQLPPPNTAPLVEAANLQVDAQRWKGPEPVGEFEYCFTYTWGKRDIDNKSPGLGFWATDGSEYVNDDAYSGSNDPTKWDLNRYREPLFESAPSPVVAHEVTAADSAESYTSAAKLTFPNIEYMMGFGVAGNTSVAQPTVTTFRRYGSWQSGINIRIYRRRKSFDLTNYTYLGGTGGVTGQHVPYLLNMDVKDDFFLLAEMRVDELNSGIFYDNGTIIPDYQRPLRDIHGYQGIRFHPIPDARYEVEFRAIVRPQEMKNEYDVPKIHAEASEVLINRTLMIAYEHLNEPGKFGVARGMFEQQLGVLKNRYADLKPQNQVTYRRPARASARRGLGYVWWKPSR